MSDVVSLMLIQGKDKSNIMYLQSLFWFWGLILKSLNGQEHKFVQYRICDLDRHIRK